MGNYFGFSNIEELEGALACPELTFENPSGSILSRTLEEQHHFISFPRDYEIVIVFSRFHKDPNLMEDLKAFPGFCIINDIEDNIYGFRELLNLCIERKWVYIKHQLYYTPYLPSVGDARFLAERYDFSSKSLPKYLLHKAKLLRFNQLFKSYVGAKVAAYSPTLKFIRACKSELFSTFKEDREYDICFLGAYRGEGRKSREDLIEHYLRIANRLGLKTYFHDGRLSLIDYYRTMTNSKVALSFAGWGPRCRREWEIICSGAMLYNDAFLKGKVPLSPMQENFHYSFQPSAKYDLEENLVNLLKTNHWSFIAKNGLLLAKRSYGCFPTIEWRMIYQYCKDYRYQWNGSYDELSELENGALFLESRPI